jgi:hypothetical protein
MGTLQFQKRWFKSQENYDRFKSQGKDKIRAGSYFLIGLVLKIYLQILFLVGAYQPRKSSIDKQIKWCYTIFDKLEIPYQKYY